MSIEYDVRNHRQEEEIFKKNSLAIIIGKVRKEVPLGTLGKKYLLEYRYTRVTFGGICFENDFKFCNFLLSAIKVYERHKGTKNQNVLGEYIFMRGEEYLRIDAEREAGRLLSFQLAVDSYYYSYNLVWLEIHQLQNALIKAMNWFAPEQSDF